MRFEYDLLVLINTHTKIYCQSKALYIPSAFISQSKAMVPPSEVRNKCLKVHVHRFLLDQNLEPNLKTTDKSKCHGQLTNAMANSMNKNA